MLNKVSLNSSLFFTGKGYLDSLQKKSAGQDGE